MRIALIGGGSTYAPLIIQQLARVLPDQTLLISLFDSRAEIATEVATSPLLSELSPDVSVRARATLVDALDTADIVFLLYRAGPPGIRASLEALAADYGLLAQETQGICGFLSALLNISFLREVARLMLAVCPQARVVVLTNPTGIVTAAAQELSLDAVGICELPYGMRQSLALGLDEDLSRSSLDVTYVGLNHFGWMVRAVVRGTDQDLLAAVPERAKRPGVYVPPSIPAEVAKAAYDLKCSGVPNPYIGYLSCTHNKAVRAEEVRRTQYLAEVAIRRGSTSDFLGLMRQRGGFLVGDTIAELIEGMVSNSPISTVICSRNLELRLRFGFDAAYEFSAVSDPSGLLIPSLKGAELSSEAETMVRVIANYEAETVRAALEGSVGASTNAIILNPYINPGSAGIRALRRFLDSNAGAFFADGYVQTR